MVKGSGVDYVGRCSDKVILLKDPNIQMQVIGYPCQSNLAMTFNNLMFSRPKLLGVGGQQALGGCRADKVQLKRNFSTKDCQCLSKRTWNVSGHRTPAITGMLRMKS